VVQMEPRTIISVIKTQGYKTRDTNFRPKLHGWRKFNVDGFDYCTRLGKCKV
jgi:hypothetical protein